MKSKEDEVRELWAAHFAELDALPERPHRAAPKYAGCDCTPCVAHRVALDYRQRTSTAPNRFVSLNEASRGIVAEMFAAFQRCEKWKAVSAQIAKPKRRVLR